MKAQSRRKSTAILLILSLIFLVGITIAGYLVAPAAMETDFTRRDIAPCLRYPFGTDWMGRDMLLRTLSGLSMSIRIGLLTASISAGIALLLGSLSAMAGRAADAVITWMIDLFMGVPHMLLLILISFAVGKGFMGVLIGVTMTHWMSLARVLRGEILQLRESGYIAVAERLGKSRLYIAGKHMLPHLLPQFSVGLVLLFPHAILHEAGITFLGFGLPPEQPAIGIILSESMRYLAMGKWWLAVFPGLLLAATVLLFDVAGNNLRRLTDPAAAHN
jgi:ABC-type dipeptide/oligopeptide/nickel transport system permease subunit